MLIIEQKSLLNYCQKEGGELGVMIGGQPVVSEEQLGDVLRNEKKDWVGIKSKNMSIFIWRLKAKRFRARVTFYEKDRGMENKGYNHIEQWWDIQLKKRGAEEDTNETAYGLNKYQIVEFNIAKVIVEEEDLEILRFFYDQLCTAYHKVDEFRAKLLGLLPLASGVAIYGALDAGKKISFLPYLTEIGLFGIIVTIGLFLYELKGIQKCTAFIANGAELERRFWGKGTIAPAKFTALSQKEVGWRIITEPVASALVYAVVIAGWTYLTCTRGIIDECGDLVIQNEWRLAVAIFVFIFFSTYAYWMAIMSRQPTQINRQVKMN